MESEFIDITSFNYETIDELILRLQEYKKKYGGKSSITIDICEIPGLLPEIYYGLNIPKKGKK